MLSSCMDPFDVEGDGERGFDGNRDFELYFEGRLVVLGLTDGARVFE